MDRRFEIDDMIGDYRVTGFLGQGGMGVVYRGIHEKLGRSAAIKILGTAVQDESFKTRFFNEARLQAGLHHPNIATLYDFREEGDQLVIIMELVDGECLEDLIERRAFTVDETLTVFASICEAIAFIHRAGVIHRDIKAQNAKLTSSGVVKLLDFGIAKDSASHGLTMAGGVIGTPTYLSPEQLEGRPATPQTDIWALGVLLYEMLTGNLPFEGDTLGGLVLKITKAEFAAPEKMNPAVPREVTAIVHKCLKKDIAARYSTVDELFQAVQKVLNTRHGKATAHDLQTIAFKSEPAIPGTAFVTASEIHRPDYEPPPPNAKEFPVALVAGIGGAAVLILFIVIGSIFLFSSGEAKNTQTSATSNLPVANGKSNAKVRVDVDEGKAQVLKNGQLLGSTPLDIDANLGETLGLTLHRDGYADKNVNIEVTNGKKVFTFSLKAK